VIERILVPMDGSRQSSKALEYAIDVALRFNAMIVILRVVTVSMLSIASSTPSSGGPLIKHDFITEAERRDRRMMSNIRKYLQSKLKTVMEHGVEGTYRIMTGDAGDSIITCCKKEDIDLVVMSAHNKGWLKRALVGSVTDYVLRSSEIPVLVLRKKRKR
jgi:nucleotide-binding universal stress UspA family protein